MNHVDIILAIPLALGAIRGFFKGFIHEAASLIGLIAGVFLAVRFAGPFSDFVLQYLDWNPYGIKIISFVLVFVAVLIFVILVGKIIESFFKITGLNILNRIAGIVAGIIKLAFILSIVLIFFNYLNRNEDLMSQEVQDSSYLYNKVAAFVPSVVPSNGYFTVKSKVDRVRQQLNEELNEVKGETDPL
jgi:membrane protein required for colicin V production